MAEENYYTILQVSPNASFEEIKKAYRKLAMQFHPDRQQSELTENKFLQIQKAYQVLSNPVERQKFHYSRFHSLIQKSSLNSSKELVTELKNIADISTAAGHFRIDEPLLEKQLKEILSEHNLLLMKHENEELLRNQFIYHLLSICSFLSYTSAIPFINSITIIATEAEKVKLYEYSKNKKRWHYWDTYKLLIAVGIAAILCLMIYFLGR